MKRKWLKLTAGMLTFCLAFAAFAGCTQSDPPPVGSETIQISYSLGSYGTAWIEEAVKEFNKTFANKGYSAVITRSDATFRKDEIDNEIKDYKNNTYDLYFSISKNMSLVDASFGVLGKIDECLLEDLTDVYNSKIINLDGSESNETVLETRSQYMLPNCRYDLSNQFFKGKYYGYQWTSAYSGIAVNTDVLKKLGYDHAPRTTVEMKQMCEALLEQKLTSEQGKLIYPMVWPGNNASGYSAYLLLTWMAQYMGVEDYFDFFRFSPKTGTMMENGYDVYDNEGILYALKAEETFFAKDYAVPGSVSTLTHLNSDIILGDGEALFEVTGDWAYNEFLNLKYSEEELECIEIMPVPVLSELADKIGLSGSAEQKDAALSNIIKGVDDGKTDAVIASELNVREDMVATVREARGIYFDLGEGHQAYIPSYSDAKNVAKLFLRFISSEEFSEKIYSKYAHGITANVNATSSDSNYLKSLSKVCRQSYCTPVSEAVGLSEIRSKAINFTFEPMSSYGDIAKGMAMGYPEYAAETVYEKVKNTMKGNWEVNLSIAGYYE